jgi:hypothetical protein
VNVEQSIPLPPTGNGWYATRRTDTGTRIWKIAEPAEPPVHFFSGRDGGGDKSSPVAG